MKKTASRPAGGADAMVLGLFFLSGASALIYEVVWSRLLGFIFGGTAFAIATVLAAYMAGLALGSWYFGRRMRSRPRKPGTARCARKRLLRSSACRGRRCRHFGTRGQTSTWSPRVPTS